jgi:hypothetical protein
MPAYLDDYLGTIAPRRQSRRRQSASLPFDLTPEQTTSLIGRAGGRIVSGLSVGANVLDLPGSMVRDVIGGVQTGDWSRHNPFDQLIDPFGSHAEENRVTGRDLLRNAGAIGKKDTWGNWWGGLGVDILTDPTMLMGGIGLAGKAGKAAKALDVVGDVVKIGAKKAGRKVGWREGAMLTSMDDLINAGKVSREVVRDMGITDELAAKPLGAAMRFYGPLASVFGSGIGTGKVAQKAARGLDIVGEAIRYAPGVRHAYGAFSKKNAIGGGVGATSKGGQQIMEDVTKARQRGNVDASGEMADLLAMDSTIHDAFDLGKIRGSVAKKVAEGGEWKEVAQGSIQRPGQKFKLDVDTGKSYVWENSDLPSNASKADIDLHANRKYNEISNAATRFVERVGDAQTRNELPPELVKYRPQLEKTRDMLDEQKRWEVEDAGLDTQQLSDIFVEYMPRTRYRFLDSTYLGTKGAVSATHPHQLKRLSFLKDMPDGTALIQDLSVDPQFSGVAHKYAKSITRPGVDPARGLDAAIEALNEGKFVKTPTLGKQELDGLVAAFKTKYGPRARITTGLNAAGEQIGMTDDQIRSLVHWTAGLDPKHAQQAIPAFERNPLVGLQHRMEVGRAVGETNKEFLKQIAAQAVHGDGIRPGRGMPLADVVAKMHGKDAIEAVPERTKAMLMEHLQQTPGMAEVMAESAAKHASAVREKTLKATMAGEELTGRFAERHAAIGGQLDSLFEDAGRKQALLNRYNATEAMAQTLEDMTGEHARTIANRQGVAGTSPQWDNLVNQLEQQMQAAGMDNDAYAALANMRNGQFDASLMQRTMEHILSAVEEVKPDAVMSPMLRDLRREFMDLANPLVQSGPMDIRGARRPSVAGSIAPTTPVDPFRGAEALRHLATAGRSIRGQAAHELRSSTISQVRDKLSSGIENVFTKARGERDRVLGQAAKRVGEVGEVADDFADSWTQAVSGLNAANRLEDVPLQELHRGLREALDANLERTTGAIGNAARNQSVEFDAASDALKNMFLPEEVANDVIGIMQGMMNPKQLGPVMQTLDRVLSHWRAAVTTAPAFHSRNHSSSNIQSALAGIWTPTDYVQGWQLARGKKTIKGLADAVPEYKRLGLTDEQAMAAIKKEIYQHEVNSLRHGQHVTQGGKRARRFVGETPLFEPVEPGTTAWQRANPLSVETFEPFRISGSIGDAIEQQARITPYLNLRKKGWSPAAAAKRVLELQVDYRGGAAMDATMRRLFPFWSFTKGSTHFLVNELVGRPGGAFGQTIKGINRASNPGELTPDYVAESAAVPMGQLPDGSNRYLTGAGLMMEDPLSFGGSGVRGGLMEAASRMNPLIKGPLEWMSGQTFFQKGPAGGRPLKDLDPTVGRTIANIKQQLGGEETRFAKPVMGSSALEFVLANSPLSRVLTTARTASDPRKGALGKIWNLGTGFKVTDVSPGSQDALLQERADQAMKTLGARDFTLTYLPEDVKAGLSPEQQVAYLQLMAIKKAMQARKRERVEAAK